MSYTTIPIFSQQRRLYREMLMKYTVSSQENPHNYPLYFTHSDLDSFILYNDGDIEEQITQLEDDAPDPKDDTMIAEVRNPMVEENKELPTDF
jgi:hypothetical protein